MLKKIAQLNSLREQIATEINIVKGRYNEVKEFVLMQSMLTKDGPIYSVVKRFECN